MPHMTSVPGHVPPIGLSVNEFLRTPPDTVIRVGIVLRPRYMEAFEEALQRGHRIDAGTLLDRHGPDDATLGTLETWSRASGLTLESAPHGGFLHLVRGRARAWEAALGITFREFPGRPGRFPDREPALPTELAEATQALVGLDTLGSLRPALRLPRHTDALANGGTGFRPLDIRRAYGVPDALDGSGRHIGILEFSNGYSLSDLTTFWSAFGIRRSAPHFVSVAGGANDGGRSQVDMEATLDLAWAGALAQGADLIVYEAPAGSTETSFGLAVLEALHATVTASPALDAVSVSYGDGETQFTPATLKAWEQVASLAALTGPAILVAAGDQGSYGLQEPDGPRSPHVDTPADLPHVTAVGGTRLTLGPDGAREQEVVWSDTGGNGATGGGISQSFPVPSYQANLTLPQPLVGHAGRGVPDVALNADPDTGYALVFQGGWTVIGGTSAAAPAWAAFVALMNQERAFSGHPPLGFLNPVLYALKGQGFYDITQGSNSYDGVPGYGATKGWDAVTGWGTPDVSALLQALGPSSQAG